MFVYDLNYKGGVETLLLRLCRYLQTENKEIVVWTEGMDNGELCRELLSYGVNVFDVSGLKNCERKKAFIEHVQTDRDSVTIHFTLNSFLKWERRKKRYSANFVNKLYVVHPNQLVKGLSIPYKCIKRYVIKTYGQIIQNYIENKSIVFMDDECISKWESYYERPMESCKYIMARLPMFIDPETRGDDFVYEYDIMAAARAEFPFKGYLLGLINDFREINIYSQYKMLIISDGKDVSQLTNLLKDEDKSISYLSYVRYEEFIKYLKKSKIFVGMGTSVLDAANAGTLSVMAQPYTNDFVSNGYFHEAPFDIGKFEGKSAGKRALIDLLQMSNVDYVRACKLSREMLAKYYNIEIVAEEIIDSNVKCQRSLLTIKHAIIDYVNTEMRIWLNRL